MKITYWSDYACPYCYIGETHLKKAIDNLELQDVEIEMKAFELDPSASRTVQGPTVDRFAVKYGLTKAQAQDRVDGISQMGREAGLDFRYAETQYTNTFDAHRLTKLAQAKGDTELTDRLIERLYKAYFTDSLELADHDVLKRIAIEEGMDEKEVTEVLDSDKYADEVRLDERESQSYGIHAVPYFIIGNRIAIPGALPVKQMESVLTEVMEAEAKEAVGMQGMSCGPDGCHIG